MKNILKNRALIGRVFWLGLAALFFVGDPFDPGVPNRGTITMMKEMSEGDSNYHRSLHFQTNALGNKVWNKDYKHFYLHIKEKGVVELNLNEFFAVRRSRTREARWLALLFVIGSLFFYFWHFLPHRKRQRDMSHQP